LNLDRIVDDINLIESLPKKSILIFTVSDFIGRFNCRKFTKRRSIVQRYSSFLELYVIDNIVVRRRKNKLNLNKFIVLARVK